MSNTELMENWITQVINASSAVFKVKTNDGLPILDNSEFFTKEDAICNIIETHDTESNEFSKFMTRNEYITYYCSDNIPTQISPTLRRPNCAWPGAICPGYCGGECCAMSSLMVMGFKRMHY